jgi:alkaline phosphatase
MRNSTPRLLAAAMMVAALVPASAHARQTAAEPEGLFDRAAAGDVRTYGGATRVASNSSADYAAMAARNSATPVRNVILLIGDGMGDSEITMARNYAEGAGGYFKGIDALPVSGHYTHYSLHKESGLPNYVTDSAASATAFSSGIKTYNGALGIDITGKRYDSILTLARKFGFATGNVTTEAVQDATPGAQYAHISRRDCFGPDETTHFCSSEALESGGLGSISEQLLANAPDVTFGGGAASFRQRANAGQWKGRSLSEQAVARGFTIVTDSAQVNALSPASLRGGPILGLFSEGNMPVRWLGPKAHTGGHIKLAPVTCEVNSQRDQSTPQLAQLTRKAIELLSSKERGFFLQVEGASIDKQSHAANPCGQIGETVDLDEAVQVALEFAKRDGNTLVIVTADHAHSGQIIGNDTPTQGLSLSLNTHDGTVMSFGYGNGDGDGTDHTGAQLRVAAYGPRAFNVSGLLDQTDIHFIIRDALGLTENPAAK